MLHFFSFLCIQHYIVYTLKGSRHRIDLFGGDHDRLLLLLRPLLFPPHLCPSRHPRRTGDISSIAMICSAVTPRCRWMNAFPPLRSRRPPPPDMFAISQEAKSPKPAVPGQHVAQRPPLRYSKSRSAHWTSPRPSHHSQSVFQPDHGYSDW